MKYIKKIPIFKIALLFIALLTLQPEEAEASHFRYGNITWERVAGNPYQIRFRVTQAWRRSFWGSPGVGSNISTGTLITGAGNATINLTVTSVNIAEDWFYGEFTYVKTYPSTTSNYTAYFQSCCRIGSPLLNNANGNFRVSSIVTVGNNNDAPVSTVPPFISLPVNTAAATYQIPATDPNNDALTFSLAPNGQFGSGSQQPPGISVSSSGLLTFNTVGKTVGRFYNTAVFVTDSKGARVQLDLMIRIAAPSTPPAFDYGVTPANGTNYVIQPGQTLNFSVKASDVDPGDNVALSAVGVPVGATFNPTSGNPVTQSFSWTPTLASVGTYQVNFVAQDNASIQTNSIVNIAVSLKPNFVAPTPGDGSILCYTPGSTITQTYKAEDVDTADRVVLSLATSSQSGMSFSPALPTSAANPVATNFTWNTSSANWGVNTVVVRATDTYSETKDDTVFYIINTPPVFTTTQNDVTITAGQFFSYTVGTNDADIPQGDEVEIEHTHLPSWLSIVNNNNGTWTISGTPAIADSGDHHVEIEIADKANHFRGTHCGNASQDFEITVIPCGITSTAAVTDVLCKDDATGAIDLTVNNAASPIAYSWSNSATTEDVSGLTAGSYTVTLIDNNGCTDTLSATVSEPATSVSGSITVSPSPTIAGHNPNTIYLGYGPQSVTLTVSANGGTPGYSYSWSNSATTASTTVSPTTTTTYTATITDDNGCTHTVSQKIKVIDARCGRNNNKVLVCHTPPNNPNKQNTICISASAVATHLAHGCYVGPCGAAKGGRGAEGGTIGSLVNVEEVASDITVYPNPTTGQFVITLPSREAAQVMITNISGQVVYSNSVENTTKLNIDMSQNAKGIYLVQVISGHDTFRSKLTIE